MNTVLTLTFLIFILSVFLPRNQRNPLDLASFDSAQDRLGQPREVFFVVVSGRVFFGVQILQ